MIVTFYSYKGGVGRTMTLMNVAEILASWGYRVIACDWDLEAPGVERYLLPPPPFRSTARDEEAAEKRKQYEADLQTMFRHDGLMDLLREYKNDLSAPVDAPRGDQFAQLGPVWIRKPSSWAYAPHDRKTDVLRVLSAGRREGDQLQVYAENVRTFDWTEFYEKWAGSAYLEFFRRDLTATDTPGGADIVLIDSRTGVTEQGGVCTHHLADLVVLMTAPNEANMAGTRWMAEALSSKKLHAARGKRPIVVLPVESRVEVVSEKEFFLDFDDYFADEFERFLPPSIPEGKEFFGNTRMLYLSFYSYQERLVAREEKKHPDLFRACEQLAYAVVRCGLKANLLAVDHSPAPVRSALGRHGAGPVSRRLKGTVFLSYARTEQDRARGIAQALEGRGAAITSDPQDISDVVAAVFVFGSGAPPPWFDSEMELLLRNAGNRAVVVPVVSNPRVLPPRFAEIQSLIVPPDEMPDSAVIDDLVGAILTGRAVGWKPAAVSPWPGRRAYEENEARFFFGREDELRQLVRSLDEAVQSSFVRWLRIEGPGGAGVTSIVRAGLIQAVRSGEAKNIPRDASIVVVPAAGAPIENLTAALAAAFGTAVGPDPAAFIAGLPIDRPLLLVIDGLDRISTQEVGVQAAYDTLLFLLASKEHVTLITTSRAPLDPHLAAMDGMSRALGSARLVRVGPLSAEQVRGIVIGPAVVGGVTYEPGLAERIAGDTPTPSATPALLSATLSRVWSRRNGTLLTHAAYDEMGGLAGMVRSACEALFNDAEDLDLVRDMILRLVFLPRQRRVRSRKALLEGRGSREERERVLCDLEAASIVRIDGDEAVLSHDAIYDVPLVRRWIEKEEESKRLRRRSELEVAAERWMKTGRSRDALPRGDELRELTVFDGFNYDISAYLAAARSKEKRRQALGTVLAIMLTLIAVGFAVRDVLLRRTDPGPTAVEDYATISLNIADYDPTLALRYAIRAWERKPAEPLVTKALRKSIDASLKPVEIEIPSEESLTEVAAQAPVVAVKLQRRLLVWNLARRAKVGDLAHDDYAESALSADGDRVLIAHDDALPEVWSMRERKPIAYAPGASGVTGGDISPDGSRVVTVSDTELALWEVGTGPRMKRLWSRPGNTRQAEFTPDGAKIVVLSQGSLAILSTEFGVDLRGTNPYRNLTRFVMSRDGSLVVGGGTSNIVVFRTSDGSVAMLDPRELGLADATTVAVGALENGNGGLLVGTMSGDVALVELTDRTSWRRRVIQRWSTGFSLVRALALAPGGKRFASSTIKQGVQVWSTDGKTNNELGRDFADSSPFRIDFTADGRWCVVSEAGKVHAIEDEAVIRYRNIPDAELGPRAKQRLLELTQEPSAVGYR